MIRFRRGQMKDERLYCRMTDGNNIVFVDLEVNPDSGQVREYGAVSSEDLQYRGASAASFERML